MKKFLLLASGCWLLVGGSLANAEPAALSPFDEANSKYQAGDFKSAAGLYEKMIQDGQATPAVYYNLGNAHFRSGRKGKALIAYERALKALPRDEDLRWNVHVLKSVLPDRIEARDESLTLFWLRLAAGTFTMDEMSLGLTVLLGLWFGVALLSSFYAAFRPSGRGIQALVFLIFVGASVLFAFKWVDTKDPRVVILEKEAYARNGPSERETKAFLLHEGAEAKVLDESKEWLYVILKNKNSGWIQRKTCEVI